MISFLIYIITINILTCIMYGVDKMKAISNKRRITEKTLIGMALVGGSLGALIGMQSFRHKTKHLKFKIIIPLCLFIHVVLLLIIYLL